MTPNLQMEQLSLAYIRAVAASAGYQVTRPELDVDSVDGVLASSTGHRPKIEFQAKATSRNLLRQDGIHFPLPVKNYKELRIDAINPRILIVLIMPQEPQEWINQTNDALCLRHCAYWKSLKEEPETDNDQSITVYVPLDNVFDSTQLTGMMQRIERTGAL